MTKLKYIRLANSVKCGPREETYFTDKDFDLTLVDAIKIRVVHRATKQQRMTSLFNAIFWEEHEDAPEDAEPQTTMKKKRAGGE